MPHNRTSQPLKSHIRSFNLSAEPKPWLVAAAWVYFTLVLGWLAAYLLIGDRQGYLALVNTLAVYLFIPLPLVLLLAPFVRRREIWAGGLAVLAAFAWFWGALLIPGSGQAQSEAPSLKVMTYNVLGNHTQSEAILTNIRSTDPDLVFIQELNPELALSLQTELAASYPFQILDPQPGVTGMGTVSKYPIRPAGRELPLEWVGRPQAMLLEWQGLEILLVNFHMYPSGLSYPWAVEAVYRAREAQATALTAFVRGFSTPVLAAGDANVTHLSEAYQIFTAELHDAWRDAGWGFGHTFPGSDIIGSARPRIAGRPVPKWLARIDYILYSDEWQVISAEMAPFDGVSDHRAVLAEFVIAD